MDFHRHINTDSDSEVILNLLAHNLQQRNKLRINEEDIFEAIVELLRACKGGYACVGMITGYGIIAFRDPHGIRPLVYGKRETPDGTDYMIASESVALSVEGYTLIADVQPGEAIIITKGPGGQVFRRRCIATEEVWAPCIFEYVYFARPDSIIDGVSVYRARYATRSSAQRRGCKRGARGGRGVRGVRRKAPSLTGQRRGGWRDDAWASGASVQHGHGRRAGRMCARQDHPAGH